MTKEDLAPLLALIREYEGCKLKAYLCPAGIWTCGWGSTGADVKKGTAWTQEIADARMWQDACQAVTQTLSLCPGLSTNTKALCAIADFVYNMGASRLQSSTLRKRINEGNWTAAKKELQRWVYGKDPKTQEMKPMTGLLRRRSAEIDLLEA